MAGVPEEVKVYIAYQEAQNAELARKLENLTNMVLNLRKNQFGSKSDKNIIPPECGEQVNIFNEAEEAADANVSDPTAPAETTVSAHRRKRPAGNQEKLLEGIPVKEVEFDLPRDAQTCPRCENELERIGREYVRTELEYVPAHVEAIKYYRASYACKACAEGGACCDQCEHAGLKECGACKDRPRTLFIQAPVPPEHRCPVLQHSIASASAVANVLYGKYALSLPLYRQVQEWKRAGVELSRATLANWVLAVSRDWLEPICGHLKQRLLGSAVLHCDETTVQVLHEEGKKATSESYMWVYRTGEWEARPAVLFDYQATRSGEAAMKYLKGFHGFFITDGYSGYNKVQDAVRCGCWAHVRRKFIQAQPGTGQEAAGKSAAGVSYCNELFRIEEELKELSAEERRKYREERSRPVLDAFWLWIRNLNPLPNSLLGKAAGYATGQKAALEKFLLDGRIPLSNNADENAIRPFVVGRKNWLFSNTPRGAAASAVIYSLVESAKANGLDVYKYLRFLLARLPAEPDLKSYETLEKFTPWSAQAQMECR